jgi:hypothetical protein
MTSYAATARTRVSACGAIDRGDSISGRIGSKSAAGEGSESVDGRILVGDSMAIAELGLDPGSCQDEENRLY